MKNLCVWMASVLFIICGCSLSFREKAGDFERELQISEEQPRNADVEKSNCYLNWLYEPKGTMSYGTA